MSVTDAPIESRLPSTRRFDAMQFLIGLRYLVDGILHEYLRDAVPPLTIVVDSHAEERVTPTRHKGRRT